jgi:hypothetical protein
MKLEIYVYESAREPGLWRAGMHCGRDSGELISAGELISDRHFSIEPLVSTGISRADALRGLADRLRLWADHAENVAKE